MANFHHVAKVYEQRGGNCYAFAACSAYDNTNALIYGSKKQPSFAECEETNNVSIRDILTISVIVVFSTSQSGWESVANGELMHKMNGKIHDSHAALVEGYDLERDCLICKNSWGENSAQPRFNFVHEAAHACHFIRVYFTNDSIRGKTNKIFIPNISKFVGNMKGMKINCA